MDNKSDEYFMRSALQLAELALNNDWIPVGAVFVKDSQIIAHGKKDGSRHSLFDHAEHNACYQALWSRDLHNLAGFTVYSTLEPCIMCLSMLMTARVSRIVYGLDDPYGGGSFILSRPEWLPARFQEERPVLEGGILEGASKNLLRQFFSKRIRSRSKHKNWSNTENALVKHVME